ncbi:MAG: hypothetical protein ACOY82_20950 [Pseudomonadota bacterium]
MSPIRQNLRHALSRAATAALLVALSAAVLGASGCSWFRKKDYYAVEESQRPLEFPPSFDAGEAERSLATTASGSVTRSSLSAPTPAGRTLGFSVSGDRASVFARVGEALAATPDVAIASRAQVLGAYDVDYQGQKFLIRITEAEGRSTVSAVDPRGLPADNDGAARLIASLKAALGGQ